MRGKTSAPLLINYENLNKSLTLFKYVICKQGSDSQMALVVKNLPANTGDVRDTGSILGLGRSPGGGYGNPLVFLPGESHGPRILAGYSP